MASRADEQPALPGIAAPLPAAVRRRPVRQANDLDGSRWLRYSISIWSDIRKSAEERRLDHPAVFPAALAGRLIECYTRESDRVVLDPFVGSGSTLVAACRAGKTGIGVDHSSAYLAVADERLRQAALHAPAARYRLVCADARSLHEHVESASVDLCVTSPPYWDILSRRRTADLRPRRDYRAAPDGIGDIAEYPAFVDALAEVFDRVRGVLRPGAYCIVNVMDLRKKRVFYPLHADLASRLAADGSVYDDLFVWDRRQEYNGLRPLGFPSVFRVNKVHEYLLVFRAPLSRA